MWWTNQEGDQIEIIAVLLGAGTRANADGDANVRGTYNSTPWYYALCRHRAPVLTWSAVVKNNLERGDLNRTFTWLTRPGLDRSPKLYIKSHRIEYLTYI